MLTAIRARAFVVLAGLTAASFVLLSATPVAQAHGDAYTQQLICLMAAGSLGLLYCLFGRRIAALPVVAPRPEGIVLLLPLYTFFQAILLPIGLVRVLSPARARIADALLPIYPPESWISLSLTSPRRSFTPSTSRHAPSSSSSYTPSPFAR